MTKKKRKEKEMQNPKRRGRRKNSSKIGGAEAGETTTQIENKKVRAREKWEMGNGKLIISKH